MATIDRTALLDKADLVLPDGNILSDELMLLVLEQVIAQIGDDTSNEPEIFCKYLRAVAYLNDGKGAVDAAPITSETAKNYSVKYNSGASADAWQEFVKKLKYICPIFGYTIPVSGLGVQVISKEGEINVFTECEQPR